MSSDSCGYTLDISEHFFHLTTETLRLHSNETKRYQTLANLVDARASLRSELAGHDPDTIRDHLRTVPTEGDIRISLTISRSSADSLAEAKRQLDAHLGSSLTLGDALSVLLFDYVVEQKAAGVMKKIGLGDTRETSEMPGRGGANSENVVPFR